jgi:hypothetical protein
MRYLILALVCLLSACANYQAGARNPTIRASYDAADQLIGMTSPLLPKDAPLLMATFVDIDKLTSSSTIGRMLAEQVSARFTQRGYAMIELKLRGNVFVQEGRGELLLSREVKDLSLMHNVQAVVVGTYAVSPEKLFINLKIVRPGDSRILAAHNIAVDLDEGTRALLMSEPS